MKKPMSDDASPWWSQARAALARLFGHVQVRELGLNAPCIGAFPSQAEAVAWPAPAGGAHENTWLFTAGTQKWQPPAVPAGGGELNGAALLCMVSGSAVPHLPETGVHGGKADALSPQVRAVDISQGEGGSGTVLPIAVGFSGGQACPLPVALPLPPVRAVSVALEGSKRMAAGREKRSGVPAFGAPRAWSQIDRITRVPLLRRRAVPSGGAGAKDGFIAERQALASACGAAVEDVTLLASFPHVPLTLVQQMAVTADGELLRLWLRPEALASGAGWTASRVTIVLGRRRLTGETIRAVLPETQTAGRKQ